MVYPRQGAEASYNLKTAGSMKSRSPEQLKLRRHRSAAIILFGMLAAQAGVTVASYLCGSAKEHPCGDWRLGWHWGGAFSAAMCITCKEIAIADFQNRTRSNGIEGICPDQIRDNAESAFIRVPLVKEAASFLNREVTE